MYSVEYATSSSVETVSMIILVEGVMLISRYATIATMMWQSTVMSVRRSIQVTATTAGHVINDSVQSAAVRLVP